MLISSGSDFVASRELRDVVGRAECEGLDGHGRLPTSGRDEAAAITDEEIAHVVGTVEAIDYRRPRIVAHAAGAEQVRAQRALVYGHLPDALRPRRFHHFDT